MTKTNRWRKTKTPGLYQDVHSEIYYSRYRLNGKRTFRSLKTTSITRATYLHAQRNVTVVKDRQRGVDLNGDANGDFRTMGALLTELERRFVETNSKAKTIEARRVGIQRLVKNWQESAFSTFLVRNLTPEMIITLRQYLLFKAEWKRHKMKKARIGYHPRVVNQTLWILRCLTDIAIQKGVIFEQPFTQTGTMQKTLRAKVPRQARKQDIPDRETVIRIIAEMRRVPTAAEGNNAAPEHMKRLQRLANEAADHAELIAYSGMRRGEAVLSTLKDDHGTHFKIWGYKSESSDRMIRMVPALRGVLDRFKTRLIGKDTKLVQSKEPRGAIQRACKRLGLPSLHNHGLRHFFASVCIASGVDIFTVSQWLGHADGGKLAMQTYGHLMEDAQAAAAAKVDFSSQSLRTA